jgi:hypothetical protein
MKRVLLCFALAASMFSFGLMAAPPAAACTVVDYEACPHAFFDMYGPDKWPGGTSYYSFSHGIISTPAWEARSVDGFLRYNTVANSNGINLTFTKAASGNRYLPTGQVNWYYAVYHNICNPTGFSWSDVPGSRVLIARDASFTDEGGAAGIYGLTTHQNCGGGIERSLVVLNDEHPDWWTGEGYNALFEVDLLGVMVHEFGHAVGFGQSGASGCNIGVCLSGGEWPGSKDRHNLVPCDVDSIPLGNLDTMCPVIFNYVDSYGRRSLNHNDIEEFKEGY